MPSAAVDEEIWAKVLHEVQSRSSSSLPNASVVVLGDYDSGKTSLLARLHGIDDPKKGFGLEYHILNISPDYRNGSYAYQLSNALPDISPGESFRLGVWVLDGDAVYSPLLTFALKPENLKHSVVLICCSMSEPWALMETLERWTKVLKDHLSSSVYDSHVLNECREQLIRFWQEYVEPLDSSSHSDLGAKVPSMETDQFLLPLGESILSENIGIPIIVVLTKCDTIPSLEKDFDFRDEHFDFIQSHIRRFCLKYGAALVYTDAKEGRNCDTLYKYILHRVYSFPFTQPACILERDSTFVPAGWDTLGKIKIVEETLNIGENSEQFEERIQNPVVKRIPQKETNLLLEDENSFLSKVQSILVSQSLNNSPATMHRAQDSLSISGSSKHADKALSSSPSNGLLTSIGSSTKSDSPTAKAMAQSSQPEGALAQFFSNLLSKRAGQSPTGNQGNSSPRFSSPPNDSLKDLHEKSKEETTESEANLSIDA